MKEFIPVEIIGRNCNERIEYGDILTTTYKVIKTEAYQKELDHLSPGLTGVLTVEALPANDAEVQLGELQEYYDLVLKTARRCARDLRHAVDNIEDKSMRAIFRERHSHYDMVFGGTAEYHADLHREIARIERECDEKVKKLEEQLQIEINKQRNKKPRKPGDGQSEMPWID